MIRRTDLPAPTLAASVQQRRVTVDTGAGAAIDPDALSFCFPLVADDTLAAGAELAIERTALKARCDACGAGYAPDTLIAPCPSCGGTRRTLLAGRDMRAVSFEAQ